MRLDRLVETAWSKQSANSLNIPWPSLDRLISPAGGQQIMVLAAPGVGKTIFLLNLAALSGARTLYVSSDTDPLTFTEALIALATGHERTQVRERLRGSELWRASYGEKIEQQFPNLIADFDSAPTIETVAEKAMAYSELWGATPELIVLDTASDISKPADGNEGWQETWRDIRSMSRFFDCVVAVAHHVKSGLAASGTVAPSQEDGLFKADTFAEIVLGLHKNGEDLQAGVLKNRAGRSKVKATLLADYGHGRVLEQPTVM